MIGQVVAAMPHGFWFAELVLFSILAGVNQITNRLDRKMNDDIAEARAETDTAVLARYGVTIVEWPNPLSTDTGTVIVRGSNGQHFTARLVNGWLLMVDGVEVARTQVQS